MIAFVDTDVIISSFISTTGAAYFILNNTNKIDLVISDQSGLEIARVANELKIKTRDLILKSIKLTAKIEKYSKYVIDENDSHIIAAAHQSKAKFLISYNLKHFRSGLIKEKLNIIILTPAQFLQYIRSQ